jgi:tetratricopeptide (TPR) repeat protein
LRHDAKLMAADKHGPAFQLYARAARTGLAEAEYRVGRCYGRGDGARYRTRSRRYGVFQRNLCPIYERIGRYDDAIRVGHHALDVDQHDLQTLHNLALVHYRRLELDESIAFARRALALGPSAPDLHFQLAETLLLRGEFTEGWTNMSGAPSDRRRGAAPSAH